MLTNNFIALSKSIMLGFKVDRGINLKIKDINNFEHYLRPNSNNTYPNQDYSDQFTTGQGSAGWSVGSGSTPATTNDYKIENILLAGVVSGTAAITIINDTENNKVIKRCTLTITNVSNSNVTINEIGFKGVLNGSETLGSTSLSSYTVLLYRHVLSESVVLGPTNAVSFIIDFYIDT